MVDTGVVSRAGTIGFDLEQADFDLLWHSGRSRDLRRNWRTDAGGQRVSVLSAETTAHLFDLSRRVPVGPLVRIRVSRGMLAVVSRVGTAFFHHLTRCRVDWNLDQREWCVEYP
jgi:hypothetical protein